MPSNPFATLGFEPQFEIDERELQRRFIATSARHHPDLFSDPFEQMEAAERCADINAARDTLADPERRAVCLLCLLGGAAGRGQAPLPPDLLMEMMEVRERLEAAVESDDRPTLAELADWAAGQRRDHLRRIADLFRAALSAAQQDRTPALQAVRGELNGLRYVQRMIEQMPGRGKGTEGGRERVTEDEGGDTSGQVQR